MFEKSRVFGQKRYCIPISALFCLVFKVFLICPAYANVFYVAPSGNDDFNSGDGWNAPFATISNALAQTGVSLVIVTNNATYTLTSTIPLFENFAEGNYRLKANSPCLNAGTNQDWMTNAVDLDGYPRIDRLNRRVDMGCYERVSRGSIYSFW